MVTLSLARNKLRETHKATKSRFLRDLSGIESDKTISMFFVETETFLKRERKQNQHLILKVRRRQQQQVSYFRIFIRQDFVWRYFVSIKQRVVRLSDRRSLLIMTRDSPQLLIVCGSGMKMS